MIDTVLVGFDCAENTISLRFPSSKSILGLTTGQVIEVLLPNDECSHAGAVTLDTSRDGLPALASAIGPEIVKLLQDPVSVWVNMLRGTIARPACLLDVSAVQAAIDAEPELPGEMPDAIWEAIRNDRAAVAETLRIAVRATKEGIMRRVNTLYSPNTQLSHDGSATTDVGLQAGHTGAPGIGSSVWLERPARMKKEAAKTAHMLTNKTWRIFERAITGDTGDRTPEAYVRLMTHRNELDRVLNALKAYSEQGAAFWPNTLKQADQVKTDVARIAPPMTDSERAYLDVEAAESDGRTKTGMDTGL